MKTLWHRLSFWDVVPLLRRLRNSPAQFHDIQNFRSIGVQWSQEHGYPSYENALVFLRESPLKAVIKWEQSALKKMFFIHLSDVMLSLFMTIISVNFLKIFERKNEFLNNGSWLINKIFGEISSQWVLFTCASALALIVFLGNLLAAYLHAQKLNFEGLLSVRIGAQLVPYIFQHVMNIPNGDRQKLASGDLVNMAQADVRSLSDLLSHCFVDFGVLFFSVGAILWALVLLVGPAAWVGFFLILFQIPISILFSFFAEKIQRELMVRSDKRLSLITEWIHSMRLSRYFGWNARFFSEIVYLAKKQFSQDVKLNATYCLAFSLSSCWWMVVAVGLFSVLGHSDPAPRPSSLFGAMWLAGLLGHQLTPLPWFVSTLVKARVSSKRLLGLCSLKTQAETWASAPAVTPTLLPNFGKDCGFVFKNVSIENRFYANDLCIQSGSKYAVLGPVGSGKSTLLELLLGEITPDSGAVYLADASGKLLVPVTSVAGQHWLRTHVAFVPQDGFLLSAPLWRNVPLLPQEPESFRDGPHLNGVMNALRRAQMADDLESFPKGYLTELGERGINLSGGQKQRLSLARALYKEEAAVGVFDDPFSAVDIHTEKLLIEDIFIRKNRSSQFQTLICSTHRTQLCQWVDFVIYLESGRVVRIQPGGGGRG